MFTRITTVLSLTLLDERMPKTSLKTFLLIALITSIWGTTWLVIKIGLNGVSPLLGAGLRFLVAGATLSLMARIRGRKRPHGNRAISHVIVFGVFMFSIPYGLVYWGEQYIPSSLASIIFSAMPFGVIFFAHLLIPEERFNMKQGLGTVLGFIGIILIFSDGEFNISNNFTLGMLAVLGSTACSGFASVWGKKFTREIDTLSTTAYGMMFGSLLLLIFSQFESARHLSPDLLTIGSIVYLGIFGSAVTFSVYFGLMRKIAVVKLSFITFLSPIVAIFSGWIILGETLGAHVFLGTTLVFLGIFTADAKRYISVFRRPQP